MLKAVGQLQRQANLRAGLIAATIMNVNRHKKTQKIFHPKDFLEEGRAHMEPTEAVRFMTQWARSINAVAKAKPKKRKPTS